MCFWAEYTIGSSVAFIHQREQVYTMLKMRGGVLPTGAPCPTLPYIATSIKLAAYLCGGAVAPVVKRAAVMHETGGA